MCVISLLFFLLVQVGYSWSEVILRYVQSENIIENSIISFYDGQIRYVTGSCLRHNKDVPLNIAANKLLALSTVIPHGREETISHLGQLLCYSSILSDSTALLTDKERQQFQKKAPQWLLDFHNNSEEIKFLSAKKTLNRDFLSEITQETERQALALQMIYASDVVIEGNLKDIFYDYLFRLQKLWLTCCRNFFILRERRNKPAYWWLEFLYYLFLFSGVLGFCFYRYNKVY